MKYLLILLVPSLVFCGQDEWTIVNDTSVTLEATTFATDSSYSQSDAAQPGQKLKIRGPQDDRPYLLYVSDLTTPRPYFFYRTEGGGAIEDRGEHRIIRFRDNPVTANPPLSQVSNWSESYTDSTNAEYLNVFLLGMGLAATVRFTRIGLRWSRSLLADQDGG